MAADLLIYCLEKATDYSQFERFCCDLMVRVGWQNIEPLGGTGDGGRDALHASRDGASSTVFAFSCREDWRAKLKADLRRIHECGHACNTVVFVTNREVNTADRDEVVSEAQAAFGWKLDLYAVERIRTHLTGALDLLELHPAIFTPALYRLGPPAVLGPPSEPTPSGNRALSALELGIASQNLEYRVSLVAALAGPVHEPDLHGPLGHLTNRLAVASRVLLSDAKAREIVESCRALDEAANAAEATEDHVLKAARSLQAQAASVRLLLTEARASAAFLLGATLGNWDREALTARSATLPSIEPSLKILELSSLSPWIAAALERFREARSVMDVHVPSELADLFRRELSLPPEGQAEQVAPHDWDATEDLLREKHRKFREDGREAWASAQRRGFAAPGSVLALAEAAVLMGDDKEAYSTAVLLRQERQIPLLVWRRLAPGIAKGEFSSRTNTQQAVAYELIKDAETLGVVFDALGRADLPESTLEALLSAVYLLVETNGPLLRSNTDSVLAVCAKHAAHSFSRKILDLLG